MQRRLVPALAAFCGLALAVPTLASAQIVEIGKIDPAAKPGCPAKPCFAVSRTTGYQAKVGTTRGLMTVPKDGRIVAWSIALGKPGKKQIDFFNSKLGGESQAQLTILDPKRKLRSRAVAQGEPVKLAQYFGTTPQIPLIKSIPVKKGQVVALTVTTWAPALATGLGSDTSWRASREKGQCDDTQGQTAQTQANQLAQYFCLYRTARLTYGATMIATPATNETPKKKKTSAKR
jgi:hypothetical protein